MAVVEENGLLTVKKDNGDTALVYPITKVGNIDGLSEILDDYQLKAEAAGKSQRVVSTLKATDWSNNQYDFEQTYPKDAYDLSIEPDSSCSVEQLDAWSGARLVGSIESNTIKVYGDVPTVDIPIILEVIAK
ncbi:hypothetical protein AALA22_10735 [Anaerovoracaceae bacterium 41-7]|uniref:hypothetical protein n=1 Tax=Emergencia sp. JLR.KK010 TaxID=3114296 RepID=UPI0030CE1ACA